MSRLPEALNKRLSLPLVAAPMFRVSGPDLVAAACNEGVIGAFPTKNARTPEELDRWLTEIRARMRPGAAPFCPNLIMRDPQLAQDLEVVLRHEAEVVITSVGSPATVIEPLHRAGAIVLADVASLRHAELAIAAGVDGLILLTAGAGGQTGWLNPFAFARAVRQMFDGIVVLGGGVSDGHALAAARLLGCDLAYMGTRFIATHESMASDAYRAMLVEASMDDVMLTSAFTGLPANMLAPSIRAAGLNPERLQEEVDEQRSQARGETTSTHRGWRDIWSAGHSVSGVGEVSSVKALVRETSREFEAAMASIGGGRRAVTA